jgi:hypothetical protein
LTANGIQIHPIRTGTVIRRYGDHIIFPNTYKGFLGLSCTIEFAPVALSRSILLSSLRYSSRPFLLKYAVCLTIYKAQKAFEGVAGKNKSA